MLNFFKKSIVVAYCLFDYELVRQKIRGEYVTGWHTGEIMHFNTKLQEYFVTFDEKNAAFFLIYRVKLSTVAYVSGKND